MFLTSKPTMRERMRPLISLWLDLLVLRMMNDDSARRWPHSEAFPMRFTEINLTSYTGSSAPAQEFTAAKKIGSPELAQQQHDFGIGFRSCSFDRSLIRLVYISKAPH